LLTISSPPPPPRLEVDLERLPLGGGPTPVRRLPGLPGRAPVWIKEDGLYGPHGGNKARKLEWLLAAAQRRGARWLISGGALGTNHGLATALYGREAGFRTALVLVPQPADDHVRAQLRRIRATGAELHFAAGPARAFALAATLILRRAGPRGGLPYLILPGGSTPLGCVGYVEAGIELARQVAAGEIPEPSRVVVALGSGGTAAGLLLGMKAAGLRSRLVCVLVNDITATSARGVARLARRTRRLLVRHGASLPGSEPSADEIELRGEWLGGGYGHRSEAGARATQTFAEAGVALDPVYTAKAGAALLELNRRGELGPGPVLFWHTYSVPGPVETLAISEGGGE
jgi:D-cysteine desulfhydrase